MKKLKLDELNRLSVQKFREIEKIPVIIVLDNVRSMNNIGSIFRSADAFAISAVYLCGITATPPHREIQKTALGATESVEWKYFSSTREAVENLRSSGYWVTGIEQTDRSILISDLKITEERKYALIFGNEVDGVSDDVISLVDEAVEIPQGGTKHSLNVAVSAGIVFWEFYRRMKLKS
jgi:23S rRNA (guanosine2251-2'-O)-methyltransferase